MRSQNLTWWFMQDQILNKMSSQIQEISRNVMKMYGAYQEVEISDIKIDADLPILAHWISMILVCGPSLKITFKAHFNTWDAQCLAARVSRDPVTIISRNRSLDSMREYCNLTAGGVKRFLSQNKIETGISLPTVLRGFDEIFSIHHIAPVIKYSAWRLGAEDSHFFCAIEIESLEELQFTNLDELTLTIPDGSGEVEYL